MGHIILLYVYFMRLSQIFLECFVFKIVKYEVEHGIVMSCAILVHGEIGSGKTSTCLKLAKRARDRGVSIGGILSIRVYQGGELIGYDGLDLTVGEAFPLVRLRGCVEASDWFVFDSLIYAFSASGYERANNILTRSAERLSSSSIIFVDEFGRLERAKLGIHLGASKVAEALKGGGVALFVYRTDMVNDVEELVYGKAQAVYRHEPCDVEALWGRVQKCFGRLS